MGNSSGECPAQLLNVPYRLTWVQFTLPFIAFYCQVNLGLENPLDDTCWITF